MRHSVRWPGQQHEGAGIGAGTGGAANSSHHPGAFQRLKETAVGLGLAALAAAAYPA